MLLFYFEMSSLSYIALLVARMIRTFDIVAFVISNDLSFNCLFRILLFLSFCVVAIQLILQLLRLQIDQ